MKALPSSPRLHDISNTFRRIPFHVPLNLDRNGMVRKVYVNKQLPFGPTVCMPLFCAQCMCRCIGIITLSRTIVRQISFTILIIAFLVIGFLGFAECQQLLYLDSLLIGCELLDQGSLSCRQDGRPQFLPLLWIPSKCKPTYLHPIS